MTQFVLVIVIAVAILIYMIVKLNIHPVLALFVGGTLAGIGLGYTVSDALTTFTGGFGSTLGNIGCTIIFGSIIAQGIRDSGSAKSMVNFFIKLFKGKSLELSTGLASFIMSIPVFGDITGVLMAPIASVIAKRNKKSMSTMGAFTLLGSSLTHSIVPPTPGILAVALLLGADLGMVIFWGIVVCLIAYIVTWLLLKGWVAKEDIKPRDDYVIGVEEVDNKDYRNLLIKEKNLPGVLVSVSPILVPVILIALASFADMNLAEGSTGRVLLDTLGNRNLALFIGVIITYLVGAGHRESVVENFRKNSGKSEKSLLKIMTGSWVIEALEIALLPLMITAMGGGFSAIIKAYPDISKLGDAIASVNFPALLVPFILGAGMMIAVGSRTTAGMTAAALCAPILPALGLSPVFCTLLIGSGTMVGSHVSDSGFWIGTSLFNLNTTQGLKYITVLGSVCGVFCLAVTTVLGVVGIV
ncbi:MAG: GntP family permease [Oscillospiraceae bacterium]